MPPQRCLQTFRSLEVVPLQTSRAGPLDIGRKIVDEKGAPGRDAVPLDQAIEDVAPRLAGPLEAGNHQAVEQLEPSKQSLEVRPSLGRSVGQHIE